MGVRVGRIDERKRWRWTDEGGEVDERESEGGQRGTNEVTQTRLGKSG